MNYLAHGWRFADELLLIEDLPAVGGRLITLETPYALHTDLFLPLHGRRFPSKGKAPRSVYPGHRVVTVFSDKPGSELLRLRVRGLIVQRP